MRLTDTGVSVLSALDHGAYREAIARYESSMPAGDAVDSIWRAEVALYLDRLDDARAELDAVGNGLDRELSNRVQTIRAELAFWDKALDEARDLIAPVIQSTWEAGDHQGHLRATLLRARTELRRGNYADALERMKEPRRLATVLGNDYFAGIIAHCRAFAYYYLGDFKQAGHGFAEALRLLKSSEGLRWEMACRTLYAGFLADIGRYEESLSELEFCERVALDLGLVGNALHARNNACTTLLMLGRYEEIVDRLQDLLVWERATRHVYAELTGLLTLSMSLGELSRFEESKQAASEALQLAELSSSDANAFDARVLLNWAAALGGDAHAETLLVDLVEIADGGRSDIQKCEARLYAADVLRSRQPDRAASLCRQAREFSLVDEHVRLRMIAERIEATVGSGPVHIGPMGELVIDLKSGWPDFDTAMETVRRYLVFEAVQQSSGNRSEAARKLNLTRSRLHDVWRQLHGEPPRPRRDEEAASLAS